MLKKDFHANGILTGDIGVNGAGDKLYGWGHQLGVGVFQCTPFNICSSLDFSEICHTNGNGYGITTTCKLYAWGSNNIGQVGNNQTTDVSYSTPANICSSLNFKHVYTIDNGSVYALTVEGKLYSWGCNSVGQLGVNDTINKICPVAVCCDYIFNSVYIDVESFSVFAIGENYKLYAWGNNGNGQLATNDIIDRCVPHNICPSCSFRSITTTSYGAYAIDVNCKLYSWGWNFCGRLGNGNTTDQCVPVAICSSCNFNCVISAYSSTYALGTDCKLYSWGQNNVGQLGNGNTTTQCSPTAICSSLNFRCITACSCLVAALDSNGKLYTWGRNGVGQIGNGNVTNQCLPVAVCSSLTFCQIINSNGCNLFAITNNCKLYSWGCNDNGQLGNGNVTNQCLPVNICSNIDFICVVNNRDVIYAIDVQGKLYSWGRNTNGGTGNGNITNPQCSPNLICSNLYFSQIIKPVTDSFCAYAVASANNGAGGTGGTWTSFSTLSCGTTGCTGIRGTGGCGGTITSATSGQTSIYYLT
jgi:alpha-tubulin suppressor-like RCC1 family protein